MNHARQPIQRRAGRGRRRTPDGAAAMIRYVLIELPDDTFFRVYPTSAEGPHAYIYDTLEETIAVCEDLEEEGEIEGWGMTRQEALEIYTPPACDEGYRYIFIHPFEFVVDPKDSL